MMLFHPINLVATVELSSDGQQYFSLPVYGAAVLFYSVLVFGQRGRRLPFAKPIGAVLATHLACLAAVCGWITLTIFSYSSLPPWLTSERYAGRLGYTFVEVVFLAAIVLMLYLERRRIYVKSWTAVPQQQGGDNPSS
jgi:hypothetical protein